MPITRRLLIAGAFLIAIYFVGAVGFYLISGRPFLDCLFGTFIFLSTVDRPFPDSPEFTKTISYKILSSIVLVVGVGTFLYVVGLMTTLFVEGVLSDTFRRRKMQDRIRDLKDHIIVCGAGKTGIHIVEELVKLQLPFVVIDEDETVLKTAQESHKGILYIAGDATQDEVLQKAGVERAKGIISALPSDQDNLFVVITSRQLNPRARIVAKATDPRSERKIRKAGANAVITSTLISGLRMVSEMVRPQATLFLDKMLRDPLQTTRIDEVHICEPSPLIGKTLEESRLGSEAGVLVLAIKNPDEDSFMFRPSPKVVLQKDAVLVVLGTVTDIKKARELASQKEPLSD
ncbi:MAG: NAD-binding protein [Planctomycetota bacterium]|nr:NAD-binding protein [Planctomycetota bacterium]